jgi:hypothetical protein
MYPCGGGDLLTALAVFPDAELIVTLSLETIDAPGRLATLSTPRLYQSLERWRLRARRLLATGYNTTRSLEVTEQGDLPGVLAFTLLALAVHGQEPLTLRWFIVDATGLRYVAPPADGMELTFRPIGSDALRTYRHYAADLGDAALGDDSPLLAHLATLGPLAAMTKAAGFLLWRDDFSHLRAFLLTRATFMLSDASGIHPDDGRAAGRTVVTRGTWSGPPFASGAPAREPACRAAFAAGDPTPPPFSFGYRDVDGHPQLVILSAP